MKISYIEEELLKHQEKYAGKGSQILRSCKLFSNRISNVHDLFNKLVATVSKMEMEL